MVLVKSSLTTAVATRLGISFSSCMASVGTVLKGCILFTINPKGLLANCPKPLVFISCKARMEIMASLAYSTKTKFSKK